MTGTVKLGNRQLARATHHRVVGWDDCSCRLPQLCQVSLPGRDHQSSGVALLSLSAQLADDRGNAGVPRHHGQPRNAAAVEPQVRPCLSDRWTSRSRLQAQARCHRACTPPLSDAHWWRCWWRARSTRCLVRRAPGTTTARTGQFIASYRIFRRWKPSTPGTPALSLCSTSCWCAVRCGNAIAGSRGR